MYGHDTMFMLYGIMPYFAKFIGEDLALYLNKIEFKKSLLAY